MGQTQTRRQRRVAVADAAAAAEPRASWTADAIIEFAQAEGWDPTVYPPGWGGDIVKPAIAFLFRNGYRVGIVRPTPGVEERRKWWVTRKPGWRAVLNPIALRNVAAPAAAAIAEDAALRARVAQRADDQGAGRSRGRLVDEYNVDLDANLGEGPRFGGRRSRRRRRRSRRRRRRSRRHKRRKHRKKTRRRRTRRRKN